MLFFHFFLNFFVIDCIYWMSRSKIFISFRDKRHYCLKKGCAKLMENVDVCSFWCLCVTFHWRFFHSHHYRWKASNFDLCSALIAIEQWGFFCVSHLLWHGSSVDNGHRRGPVTLVPVAERLVVELSIPVLRKYATHLFTTPLSNVMSVNMMSILILTLTKQEFDNRLTHFNIKYWKCLCRMQVFKGTIFCCVMSCRRKCYNICIFHIGCFSYSTSYFSSEKDPGTLKIGSHILKSLFYKNKTCRNCKFR